MTRTTAQSTSSKIGRLSRGTFPMHFISLRHKLEPRLKLYSSIYGEFIDMVFEQTHVHDGVSK